MIKIVFNVNYAIKNAKNVKITQVTVLNVKELEDRQYFHYVNVKKVILMII